MQIYFLLFINMVFFVIGLLPAAPLTMASFGCYLALLNNLLGGHRFVCVGKALLDVLNFKDCAGEVTSIASKVSCFCQPAKAANELWIQGEQSAIAVGDMNGEGNLCVKSKTLLPLLTTCMNNILGLVSTVFNTVLIQFGLEHIFWM